MSNPRADIHVTMKSTGAEGFMMAINNHIATHFVCLLRGHAILLDEDGMWCSACEKDEFKIGCEEQG